LSDYRAKLGDLVTAIESSGVAADGEALQREDDLPALSEARLMELLQELKPLLKKRQPKKCAPILEEIKRHAVPIRYAERIEELSKHISRYRFKEAAAELESISRE
jgi:hypothetical protein